MNWLAKETATISVAFVLSVLANLFTPRIRNWWAKRSIARLKERISALTTDLSVAEKHPMISDGEDFILTIINGVIVFTGGIFTAFWAVVMFGFTEVRGVGGIGIKLFGSIGFLFILAYGFFLPRFISRFLSQTSLRERKLMEKNINDLLAKLHSMEKS